MSKKWLYGRNVVISGCSTGMGREITKILINKYGCNVLGIARNQAKLISLKEELKENSGKFTYRMFDVGVKESWLKLVEELTAIKFDVDMLINNAGIIQPFMQFDDLTDEQIDKVLNVNFKSLLYSNKIMIPLIKKSKYGAIVNVSSASAILPVAGESIYSATKSAARALTECLGQELRPYGIFVSCIMPGPVKTDLYKARESDGDKGSKVKDNFIENIGLTAERAAQKIVHSIAKKKTRVCLGAVAKAMDLGMKVMPRGTSIIAGKFIKAVSPKVSSFKTIYQEYFDNEDKIKANKKARKGVTYSKKTAVPAFKGFEKDEPHKIG
ncbi:MAG: SDR family oxidoreductase [Clostridia bacterium]